KVALVYSKSHEPGSFHSWMLQSSNRAPGSRFLAASIMTAELSTPTMAASGKRSAINLVELPGPQPRSAAFRTSLAGTACRRSRAARVRSSSNFRYCSADQLISLSPISTIATTLGDKKDFQQYLKDRPCRRMEMSKFARPADGRVNGPLNRLPADVMPPRGRATAPLLLGRAVAVTLLVIMAVSASIPAAAEISDGVVKIGLISDQVGLYADIGGP